MKAKEFNFDLKQLQSFVEVVNEKGFTRASRKLKLGQATISHHINSLEDALGVKLINRSSKDLSLTHEGIIFHEFCLKHFEQIEQLRSELSKKESSGSVRISASTIPSTYILPDAISAVQKKNPEYYYKIEISDSREAIESVKEGACDIAIVGRIIKHPQLSFTRILSDEIVLAGPPDYPDSVSVEELAKLRLITRESGSGTRTASESALSTLGITHSRLNIIFESSTSEGIKESVIAGIGASFISNLAIRRELELKRIKVIKVEGLSIKRDFYAVHLKNKKLSPAVRALIDSLRA